MQSSVFFSMTPFQVCFGSGDAIWCQAVSRGVDVLVLGVSFCVDLFHLEIAGADAVFGVARMKSLSRVLTDYDRLTIEFHLGGKHTTLYAENLL